MADEIPATEARAQFSELINRVGFGKERIILTRHGKPLVALVPAEALDDVDTGSTVLDLSARPAYDDRSSVTLAAQDRREPRV